MQQRWIDGHCDTITTIRRKGESLYQNSGQFDLSRFSMYPGSLQFFAIWLDPFYYSRPLKETLALIEYYYQEMEKNKEIIQPVTSFSQYEINRSQGKTSALLALEGGEALEGELSLLDTYYRLGVRAMTLTWNYQNQLGYGAAIGDAGSGLSDFGRLVVERMNQLGMLVDVSHLNDQGFWDVYEICQGPFIASHSNARAVCPVQRNLSDDQIRAVGEKNGVIGLNFYSSFVSSSRLCGMDAVLKHIEHILHIAGEEVLALGGDFDGMDATASGLEDITGVKTLLDEVEKAFGVSIARKLAYENFERVLRTVLK